MLAENEDAEKCRHFAAQQQSAVPYGIGCFSQEGYDFVIGSSEAGQTYWQILPLGVTSHGDSPYQSFSAFAGNPYFIVWTHWWKKGADCRRMQKETSGRRQTTSTTAACTPSGPSAGGWLTPAAISATMKVCGVLREKQVVAGRFRPVYGGERPL